MIDLPDMHEDWIKTLSLLCHQITGKEIGLTVRMERICESLERCKPTEMDIENREKILQQLQRQFEKDYPDCDLHAFGSFYNGFGFRQSDLDVCIVFKDQREENVRLLIHLVEENKKFLSMNFRRMK